MQVEQAHAPGAVTLTIKTRLSAFAAGTVELRHAIDGQTVERSATVQPGENLLVDTVVTVGLSDFACVG